MASALLRTTPALRAGLRASVAKPAFAAAGTSFVRGKATLPDLPCKHTFRKGLCPDAES